jgi:hypothetical protein
MEIGIKGHGGDGVGIKLVEEISWDEGDGRGSHRIPQGLSLVFPFNMYYHLP